MNFSKDFINFILENFNRENYDDKSFLTKFRKLLVTENSLDEYVKEIKSGKLRNCLGMYTENTVIFDINNIKNHIEYLIKLGSVSGAFYRFYNFIVLDTIIHETGHANQDKRCYNFTDKLFLTSLLRDSRLIEDGYLKLTFDNPTINDRIKAQRLYRKYHDLYPSERETEIIAFSFLMNLYKKTYQSDILGISDLSFIYYQIISNGYDFDSQDITCPLKEFYRITDNLKTFNTFDFSEYDINTKITYGMPLTEEEFDTQTTKILEL